MKIIGSEIVTKLKFVTLCAVSYVDRRGNKKKWHMATRGTQPKCITGSNRHPDAAVIVPYHRSSDKLVVIREFRIPVGDYQYGFPAGLIDPGEDIAAAAGRELYEETGLSLVRIYRHSPAIFSSAGITDEAVSMVFAEVEGLPDTRNNEDSEDIEIFLMDRHQVKQLLKNNGIIFGARAWLVMDAFAKQGAQYLTADDGGEPPLEIKKNDI